MATFGFLLPVWGFCCSFGFLLSGFGFLLLVFRRPSDFASSPSPRLAPSIRSIGSSRSSYSVAADGFLRWV
jgi:hypothetical protein